MPRCSRSKNGDGNRTSELRLTFEVEASAGGLVFIMHLSELRRVEERAGYDASSDGGGCQSAVHRTSTPRYRLG